VDTRTSWTSAGTIVAVLLAMPLAAASAQSPGAGEAGDLIGGFTAHLRGSQSEHYSSLTNVTYTGSDGDCQPGLQSHSTDQQMTIESQPLEVDAVRLPAGTAGWSGQEYVLVPRGMMAEEVTWSAPTSDVLMAPMLFELPVDVTLNKAYTDPATGAGPAEPLPMDVPCTGGDGVGGELPHLDCGERTYPSIMGIFQPQVNVALAAASESAFSEEMPELYEYCPTSIDVVPGAFLWDSLYPPTFTGGPLPTVEQLLDPNLSAVEIIGQATGGYEETGYLSSQMLDWTLTLCREGSTAPNC
jgi:hypothetical protein